MIVLKKCLLFKLCLFALIILKCQTRDLRNTLRLFDDSTSLTSQNQTSNDSTVNSAHNVIQTQAAENLVDAEITENLDTREVPTPKKKSALEKVKKFLSWKYWTSGLYYSSGGSALEENRKLQRGHLFEPNLDDEGDEQETNVSPPYRLNSPRRHAQTGTSIETQIVPQVNNDHITEFRSAPPPPATTHDVVRTPNSASNVDPPLSSNNRHVAQAPAPKHEPSESEKKKVSPIPPANKSKLKDPFKPEPKDERFNMAAFRGRKEVTELEGAKKTVETTECFSCNNCSSGRGCGCGVEGCLGGGACICCLGCGAGVALNVFVKFITDLCNRWF